MGVIVRLAVQLIYASLLILIRVQVNDLSPSLLALLLLPQMIRTSKEYATTPRIVVVSSEVHFWVTVAEDLLESPNIVEIIGSKEYCIKSGGMSNRYPLSKRQYFLQGYIHYLAYH